MSSDGMFYYTLTPKEKDMIVDNYKGSIENFVSDYLLKDNFEFSFKNLFVKNDTSKYFNLLWQPYYKDTKSFLNLNQNFEKTGIKPNYLQPINDEYGEINKNLTFYDAYGNPLQTEHQTLTNCNFSHTKSTTTGLEDILINNVTSWNVAITTYGNSTSKKYGYGIQDYIGTVKLYIVVDGESHITK
jgi:hypothetical protein